MIAEPIVLATEAARKATTARSVLRPDRCGLGQLGFNHRRFPSLAVPVASELAAEPAPPTSAPPASSFFYGVSLADSMERAGSAHYGSWSASRCLRTDRHTDRSTAYLFVMAQAPQSSAHLKRRPSARCMGSEINTAEIIPLRRFRRRCGRRFQPEDPHGVQQVFPLGDPYIVREYLETTWWQVLTRRARRLIPHRRTIASPMPMLRRLKSRKAFVVSATSSTWEMRLRLPSRSPWRPCSNPARPSLRQCRSSLRAGAVLFRPGRRPALIYPPIQPDYQCHPGHRN